MGKTANAAWDGANLEERRLNMTRRRRYAAKEILSKWQISEIPFVPILPEEKSDMRSRVITGRDEELEHLGILVEQARAIFRSMA